MNRRQLVRRLARGAMANVDFDDMVDLVEGFGFRRSRIRGSHHIFVHPGVPELVNFQEVGGQAKALSDSSVPEAGGAPQFDS